MFLLISVIKITPDSLNRFKKKNKKNLKSEANQFKDGCYRQLSLENHKHL